VPAVDDYERAGHRDALDTADDPLDHAALRQGQPDDASSGPGAAQLPHDAVRRPRDPGHRQVPARSTNCHGPVIASSRLSALERSVKNTDSFIWQRPHATQ
jgi:hypothetical protein